MATNKIKLVVKPVRSIPMVVKPVPKIGLMSMTPTKGDPGIGIESLEQTTKSTESGGTNVWTATLTDGTVHDFEVMNGDPGEGIATGGTPGQALIKASNTDYATRWMSILPEDTASGAVASFPDGSDDLPMGVVIDIDPVQDLHGYDNPWPAGGGKNLVDYLSCIGVGARNGTDSVYSDNTSVSGNVLTITQTYSSNGGILKGIHHPSIPANTTFTLSMEVKSSEGKLTYGYGKYAGGGTNQIINGLEITTNTWTTITRQFTSQGDDVGLFIQPFGGGTLEVRNLQIELGSTATAYAPYSNVCPIYGWTGAKVTRTGKNLIEISFNQINASNVLSNVFELKAGTYTLSFNYNGTPTWGVYLRNGTTASSPVIKLAYNANNLTFTLDKDYQELCISVYYANGISVSEVTNAQIERGSTAHAYEPYQGVTHEIPFSTSVYGGKLNVETGECVVEYAKKTITAFSGIWGIQSSGVFAVYAAIPDTTHIQTDMKISKMKSNIFKYTQAGRSTAPLYGYGGNDGGNTTQTFILPNTITSLAEANAWLANNPTECTFKLATPITLTLDPVEIRSLFGDNNVFADTGNTTVTYKADIQKYIDKKISAAVAAMS